MLPPESGGPIRDQGSRAVYIAAPGARTHGSGGASAFLCGAAWPGDDVVSSRVGGADLDWDLDVFDSGVEANDSLADGRYWHEEGRWKLSCETQSG